ncbi:hypothetical protein M5K25_019111 [Dendrobium thyrsiflorum]|uniref:Uncharacterized protein n=1 Tax=Dendrobium thyrsiflorum TaxID=117978 RepID=A0ABD0UE49_DENTH
MVGNLKGGRKKKENGEKEGEGRKKKKNGGRGMEEEEEEGRGRRRNLPWKLGWRGKGVAGGLDRGRTEGSGGFGVKCRGMRKFLVRPNEARIMYEKLKSHPNAEISKKARQFVFSFQAMEMMKVKDTSLPRKTGYEDYFEAFVEDKKANYIASIEEKDDRVLEQVLPYLIFLLSPMLVILFAVVKNSF